MTARKILVAGGLLLVTMVGFLDVYFNRLLAKQHSLAYETLGISSTANALSILDVDVPPSTYHAFLGIISKTKGNIAGFLEPKDVRGQETTGRESFLHSFWERGFLILECSEPGASIKSASQVRSDFEEGKEDAFYDIGPLDLAYERDEPKLDGELNIKGRRAWFYAMEGRLLLGGSARFRADGATRRDLFIAEGLISVVFLELGEQPAKIVFWFQNASADEILGQLDGTVADPREMAEFLDIMTL